MIELKFCGSMRWRVGINFLDFLARWHQFFGFRDPCQTHMASQQLLWVRFYPGEDHEKRERTKETVKQCRHRHVCVWTDWMFSFRTQPFSHTRHNSFLQLNM